MSDTGSRDWPAHRQARQNVLLGAEISGFGGGAPTKHRIRDLSSGGARVDRAGSLKVGSTVLVSVGILEQIGATVVWVEGDAAGLKFAEAIDPEAARSKTIIHPTPPAVLKRNIAPLDGTGDGAEPGAGAGWITDLDNPYRK